MKVEVRQTPGRRLVDVLVTLDNGHEELFEACYFGEPVDRARVEAWAKEQAEARASVAVYERTVRGEE